MPEQPKNWLFQWMIGLGLVLTTSAASAQPCCECRCPGNNVPACSEDFGLDEDAYGAAVCSPLGCSTVVCTDKACAQANRCPRSESGRCGDGFDNDADRAVDCADSDCTGDDACVGGPSPTPPPDGTPTDTPTTPGPTRSPNTTPTPGGDRDCCVGRDEGGGCSAVVCESCVCELDAFCCDEVWDANCAATANDECIDVCLCGVEATPTPSTPTPGSSPGPASNCCAAHEPEDGPGCSLAVCETCVCDGDDFCCTDFWDQGCAEIADDSCEADCACDTAPPLPTSTPAPTGAASPAPTASGSPGPASNCCAAHEPEDGPGCSLAVCETCVCDVDDFCCTDFWDQGCAEIADDSCEDDCACDTAPPLPTSTPVPMASPSRVVTPPTSAPTRAPTTAGPRCIISNDCPGNQVCIAGQCVGPAPTQSGGSGGGGGGGCAISSGTFGRSHGAWLVLPGLAWAIVTRRRVRARPTKRPARRVLRAARFKNGRQTVA